MFKADPIDQDQGPKVALLSCNNDPLGTIASAALMYEGKSVQSLAEITDDQRRYYLDQTAKTTLAAPLEFVNFHFLITGVTRGFTHQMVRQRTATYTQESTRFAVKEDVPVGLPPSLAGTVPWDEWIRKCLFELYPAGIDQTNKVEAWPKLRQVDEYAENNASKAQIWRREWDWTVERIGLQYNALVNAGMPAEDARGLLPTNLLTRINYNTSLRGLLEHAGVRLCTQAQFEWRLVWMEILKAIREYGKIQLYTRPSNNDIEWSSHPNGTYQASAQWQFQALSKIFKPICYQKGSCQFQADVDRACTIRDRVQANAREGRPSSKWGEGLETPGWTGITPIIDKEWMLDPSAARVSQ